MNPDMPSPLPPCPVASGIIRRVAEAGPDYVERMWAMSDRVSISRKTADTLLDVLESRSEYYDEDGDGYNDDRVISAMSMLKEDMRDLPAQWIPVSEQLPDEEKEVLVFWPRTRDGIDDEPLMAVAWVYEDDKWRDMEGELKSPTHWMPLPEPPSA